MKETLNIGIASQAFILEEDAYRLLDGYLNDIRSRLDPDDTETAADIEARVAEILREFLPSSMMVVTASHVRRVMAQIGSPDIFGSQRREEPSAEGRTGTAAAKACGGSGSAFCRSRENRLIAGICGGTAEYFGCDVSLLRLLTVLLVLFGGMSVLVYIVLWVVIPEEPVKIFMSNYERR